MDSPSYLVVLYYHSPAPIVNPGSGGWLRPLLRGGRFFRGGAAMTLGHVILARDAACLERSRPHEQIHVRQFERWGPLLLPAAWLIGRWLAWREFDPYLDHPFELEASGVDDSGGS